MSESTQAFLLGISAALAGVLLYLCITFAGPAMFGGFSGKASAKTEAAVSASEPAPQAIEVARK